MAVNILEVTHEDVAVRIFVETLTEAIADWFYHLANGVITSWCIMRAYFEAFFKTTKDEHFLLAQSTSVKKQLSMNMRDFIANFNNLANRIPVDNRCMEGNLKTFFISAMPPDIKFDLRRYHPIDLDAT